MDAHGRLTDVLGQRLDRLESLLAALRARDDLDEVHANRRVEEVHPAEPLGTLGELSEVRDRETRGVRREDGVVVGDLLEFGVDVLLDLHLLGDGLDDDVGVAAGLRHVDERGNALEGGVGLLLGELVVLGELVQ